MVNVKRFRSTWGFMPTPGYENYKAWFPELKGKGYSGIEVNINYIDNPELLKNLCTVNGLEIIGQMCSAWPRCIGPRPRLTVQDHLNAYREQLAKCRLLNPFRVNVQSGSDVFTLEESVDFFQGTLIIDEEMGLTNKVCHETHRNRSLCNPYAADYILLRVPKLRITADFSHWVVACERLLDDAIEDQELMERIYPHVYHIHSRVGTPQSSQCPDPSDPLYEREVKSFENIWKKIIQVHLKDYGADFVVSFVPEWGPYPYHAHGSMRDFSEVADTEGVRQEKIFKQVQVAHDVSADAPQ